MYSYFGDTTPGDFDKSAGAWRRDVACHAERLEAVNQSSLNSGARNTLEGAFKQSELAGWGSSPQSAVLLSKRGDEAPSLSSTLPTP